MPTKSRSNEIKITRLYEAPVETVWEAWTDPKQVAQWWGPRGFTITTHSKDLRVGGSWSYTMHGPDGVDYPNETKYFEVEKYSRLVYDHGGYRDRPPMFRVTVQFTEIKGKTQMSMSMALATPEAADAARKMIKKAGGESTWDRLGEFLAKEISHQELFVMNRTFDAPIEVMFKMWTDPKHLAQWAAPAGSTMEMIKSDMRQGGGTFYSMSIEGQVNLFGKAKYLEIQKPNRIVYTQQFCDENEKVVRHPMAPTWPETMLTTVILTEEALEKTRITLTWQPCESASKEEIDAFIKARSGMTQGWTGSFDQLELYLLRTE